MSVIPVGEIKDVISSISQKTKKNIHYVKEQALCESNIYKNIHISTVNSKSTNLKELKELNDSITTDVNRIKQTSMNNDHYVTKSQVIADDLNKRIQELQMKCTDIKKEIDGLEHKISHMKTKEKSFQKRRDKILVYKLLTNTHFSYDTKNVRGYITGNTPESFKMFDFNPQKMDNKKITDNLYNILKTSSSVPKCSGEREDKENEKE